jgi:hypothetical protein
MRAEQFNYTLSAALDLGTLVSALFIFLTLGLPNVNLNWIGESGETNAISAVHLLSSP